MRHDERNLRYEGGTGELSVTIRPASTAPDLVFPSGTTAAYLATGATTGGLFGLYRWSMSAEQGGARPHFHRGFAESFYVLEGRVRIYDGRGWVDTVPGDFVHVPPGGVHGFRNESGAAASLLIHFAPGVRREAYFEGLASHARSGPPPEPELSEFFRLHDNIWVDDAGPPSARLG